MYASSTSFLIGLLILSGVTGAGQEVPAEKSSKERTFGRSGGPYCGIYSLYGALSAVNINVPFERLCEARYVGSRAGSSVAELELAAKEAGAHAVSFQALGVHGLRSAQSPLLLHVSRPGMGTTYRHWILFLGFEAGRPIVDDAPSPRQTIPLADLLSIWDGIGVVVSRNPVNVSLVRFESWSGHLIPIGFGAATLLAGGWLARLFGPRAYRGVAPRALALLAGGTVLAALYHAVEPAGFPWNRAAVGAVAARHFNPALPRIGRELMTIRMSDPTTVVVDARTPESFDAGHLPKAINLPIFSAYFERRDFVAGLAPGARVVVYCQQDECTWAGALAGELSLQCDNNFEVYGDGWEGWIRDRKSR